MSLRFTEKKKNERDVSNTLYTLFIDGRNIYWEPIMFHAVYVQGTEGSKGI